MDFWQKARSFAEEAAKRSQEVTKEAVKGISTTKLSDVVSEASKRSKEIAAEASKRADQIKLEALRKADQIKSQIPTAALSHLVDSASSSPSSSSSSTSTPTAEDLVKYGVTEELIEFVKGITVNTFQDFPLEDDSEMSDVPTVSNVRRDLTEWQEMHAKFVLSTVKEISKLRYELCPRVMRERKFWRIYFILVNSHVAPYEKQYMEETKIKSAGNGQDDVAREASPVITAAKAPVDETSKKSKSVPSPTSEQDLDVFLLGDAGDSDEGPDVGDDDLDDDFDKL